MISHQVRGAGEQISAVIYDWLTAEFVSSSDPADVNAPLDNYQAAREGLAGGFDHKTNFTWGKHNGHMARLDIDFEALASAEPKDAGFDKFAAKLVFDALMEISGTYRNQCYAEAESQEDYMERRRQIIGISIGETVRNRLIDLVPMDGGFAEARISIGTIGKEKDETIDAGTRSIKELVRIMTDQEDPARGAQEMFKAQYVWLKLAVDSLILITKCKDGELAGVPFLEPRSIGEQSGKVWYPFREPLNWAEVMAANPPSLRPGQ